MAVSSPALSAKWWAGAACETPTRRASARRLSAAGPSSVIVASAASRRARRRWPWWYGWPGAAGRRRVLMRLLYQANLDIDKINRSRYLDNVKIRLHGGSHARETDALPQYPQHRRGAPADDRGHRIRRMVYAARGAWPPAHHALPA